MAEMEVVQALRPMMQARAEGEDVEEAVVAVRRPRRRLDDGSAGGL